MFCNFPRKTCNLPFFFFFLLQEENLPAVPYSRILALNKPEWLYVLLGVIAAAISGGVHPAFAVIFGKIIGVSFFTNEHCNPEFHSCSASSLYARLVRFTCISVGFLTPPKVSQMPNIVQKGISCMFRQQNYIPATSELHPLLPLDAGIFVVCCCSLIQVISITTSLQLNCILCFPSPQFYMYRNQLSCGPQVCLKNSPGLLQLCTYPLFMLALRAFFFLNSSRISQIILKGTDNQTL